MIQLKINKMAAVLFSAALIVSCDSARSPEADKKPRVPLAEYTAQNPAEWAGMENEHAPLVTIQNTTVNNIIIRVKFPIKHAPDHYIQKIGIMGPEGDDILVKHFKPQDDFFEARFTYPFIKSGVGFKAYVRCSLHDLWTTPI